MTPTTTMITAAAYADARKLSMRQVLRYLSERRLPGASKINGSWSIPADADPVPAGYTWDDAGNVYAVSGALIPTTTPDMSPDMTRDLVVATPAPPAPLGAQFTIEDAAAMLHTDRAGVRRMARDGLLIIGPYGPHQSLRVYMAPR